MIAQTWFSGTLFSIDRVLGDQLIACNKLCLYLWNDACISDCWLCFAQENVIDRWVCKCLGPHAVVTGQ